MTSNIAARRSRDGAISHDDALVSWARSLPKVDLHRHLEGSLRITTLIEIARSYGIDLPSYDVEELRPFVQVTDESPNYARFLDKFRPLRQLYTSAETVQRVTREAIFDAAADNVRYLELRFNPRTLSRAQDFTFSEVVSWVIEATAEAQASSGTRTCLILQIPREEPPAVAEEIVSLAIVHFGPIVRGIDLAGNEVDYPPELFAGPFRRAREADIHITAHAGEWVGAASVRAAIQHLKPQRIGHGIRSIENSQVVRLLHEQNIALEVCPTSNIQTGAVREFSEHPLPDLLNLRVPVTLNTDDPGIFNITLSDEYLLSVETLGIPTHRIYAMLRCAAEAAFIPEDERGWLRDCLRAQLAAFPGAAAEFDAADTHST